MGLCLVTKWSRISRNGAQHTENVKNKFFTFDVKLQRTIGFLQFRVKRIRNHLFLAFPFTSSRKSEVRKPIARFVIWFDKKLKSTFARQRV